MFLLFLAMSALADEDWENILTYRTPEYLRERTEEERPVFLPDETVIRCDWWWLKEGPHSWRLMADNCRREPYEKSDLNE